MIRQFSLAVAMLPRAVLLIFLVAMAASGTGCTGFDALNATVPHCGYTRTADIPYGSIPRQKLDVYQPDHVQPNTPVVIFFYGGEWSAGQKGDYFFAAQALASKGFIAVLPDYRLYPQVTFPAFVEDGAKAIRWVHDNIASYNGDPHHLYLMGHSAGAHIVALLTLDGQYLKGVGLNRSNIRATAALSGPYDFLPYDVDRDTFNMQPGQQQPDPAIEPINFVDGHAPPMLLLQGAKDDIVDPINATKLAEKIRKAGGQVKCIIYPDRGHEGVVMALAWSFRWLAPVLKDSAEFFRANE